MPARHVIGLGLMQALADLLPDLPADDYPRWSSATATISCGATHEIPLFAGWRARCASCTASGFLLAVATGKSRRGLERALEPDRPGAVFHRHALRRRDAFPSRTRPCCYELMDELASRPRATLMIGDTTHDLLMAPNAGVAASA